MNNNLQKARQKAVVGEIRKFGGRDYIYTPTGWRYYGKGSGVLAQHHASTASGNPSKFHEPTVNTATKNKIVYNPEQLDVGDRVVIHTHTPAGRKLPHQGNEQGHEITKITNDKMHVDTPNGEMIFNRKTGLLVGDKGKKRQVKAEAHPIHRPELNINDKTRHRLEQKDSLQIAPSQPPSIKHLNDSPGAKILSQSKTPAQQEVELYQQLHRQARDMGRRAFLEGKPQSHSGDKGLRDLMRSVSYKGAGKMGDERNAGYEQALSEAQNSHTKPQKVEPTTSITKQDLNDIKIPGGYTGLDLYSAVTTAIKHDDFEALDKMHELGLHVDKKLRKQYVEGTRKSDDPGVQSVRSIVSQFAKNSPRTSSRLLSMFS